MNGADFDGARQSGRDADAWLRILEGLRAAVTRQQFEMWFRNVRLVSLDERAATFAAPNAFSRDWIEGYFLPLVKRLVSEVAGVPLEVRIVVDGDVPPRPATALPSSESSFGTTPGSAPTPAADLPGRRAATSASDLDGIAPPDRRAAQAPPPAEPRRSNLRRVPSTRRPTESLRGQLFGHARYPNFLSDVLLNDDYVFETFVAGPGNAMPLAAAQAVANAPGNAYNPLFLHGLVGLGKTHLLQAICHRVLARTPTLKVLYLSCETFVNQFISSVEAGEMEDFHYRYRHVDMLLIDDIHFLARKERTQEEFFHTFNTLYNSKKQIVLSCDSPPREIPTLEERLVSRFKWGLVAELEAPDHETRIRIVRRKAERRGVPLPDGVAELIADNVATNVREIEGAVLKVIGYSTLSQRPLTRELAEEALRDVIQPKERKVSLDTILRAVCEHFGVKPSDVVGRRRHKTISTPRQVCMYLARRVTDLSLVQIGGHLGGRDHTTVIYANDRIAAEIGTNARLREDVDAILRKIRSGE